MSGGQFQALLPLKVARHALGWLVVGNLIGVLLSILLLWPNLNLMLAPFTYGRWVSLHLDFQLYGWCSFPLLALLFHFYLSSEKFPYRWAEFMLVVWSVVLAWGGWEWLHGRISGKVFLDWAGSFGVGLPVVMGLIWLVLATGFFYQLKEKSPLLSDHYKLLVKGLFLLPLAMIPFVFIKVLNPAVYPAINRASGGPTGTSLLGSTLGVIAVFWLLPLIVEIPRNRGKRPAILLAIILTIHFAFFGLLPHGSIPFGSSLQVVALGSTLIWIPLLRWYFFTFNWPLASWKWLVSFGLWGILLCVTGFGLFFSGMLGRWKFTSVLVAHSHLAMAGMMSSFNILVLVLLNRFLSRDIFGSRMAFVLWHGGLLIHLMSLGGIAYEGGLFSEYPFFNPEAGKIFLGVRLLGGLLMLLASIQWFENARRKLS